MSEDTALTGTRAPALRNELLDVANLYLDALAARQLSSVPIAPHARYTENGQGLPLGSGVWASEGGEVTYRLLFADPAQGQVGAFAVVPENGFPGVMSLRLKVEDGLITEAETLVARTGVRIFEPEALVAPRAALVQPVDPSERSSRQELVAVAEAYFDALEQPGAGEAHRTLPVHPECLRVENGHTTTGQLSLGEFIAGGDAVLADGFVAVRRMSIVDQLVAGSFGHITNVRDRRYPIVDEEQGLVLGIVLFDQPGTRRRYDLAGLGSFDLPPSAQLPTSPLIAELFKVVGGEIRAIEVVLNWFPLGMKSRWS